MLTEAELEQIAARADAATPGPWASKSRNSRGADSYFLGHEIIGPPSAQRGQFEHGADAAFIAASRSDVPALLAEVLVLRAELQAAKALLSEQLLDYEALYDRSAMSAAIARIDVALGGKE